MNIESAIPIVLDAAYQMGKLDHLESGKIPLDLNAVLQNRTFLEDLLSQIDSDLSSPNNVEEGRNLGSENLLINKTALTEAMSAVRYQLTHPRNEKIN